MKRKKRKKSSGQQVQKSNTPEEFSVDEILSQFWDEYKEEDFETGEADEQSALSGDAAVTDDAELEFDFAVTSGSESEVPAEEADSRRGQKTGELDQYREPESEGDLEKDPSWSVRDIVDEFRENELVEEITAEETVSGETEPQKEEQDSSVWESFPETSVVASPAEIPAPSTENEKAPVEPEIIEDLDFNLPYSIRDIMQEFWTPSEAENSEAAGPETEGTPSDQPVDWSRYGIGPELAPEGSSPPDTAETLDFSQGAVHWSVDAQAQRDRAENSSKTPDRKLTENEAREPDEDKTPVAPAAAAPSKAPQQTADQEDGTADRKPRKVVEEFPDSPKAPDEPFVDTLDYSALFKIFAEESGTGASEPAKPVQETPKEGKPAEDPDAWFNSLSPDEVQKIFGGEKAGQPASPEKKENSGESGQRQPKTPLLAEQSGEPDFRDILREFMLGDQHPIYGDVPGIGSAPGSVSAAKDSSTENRKDTGDDIIAAVESVSSLPRPKRDYVVEEDFPIDLEAFSAAREKEEDIHTAETAANGTSESAASAGKPDDSLHETSATKEEGARESGFRGRLRDIIAGRAGRFGASAPKKKALNEPKAYVGYEDYIPDEETAKAHAEAVAADEAEKPAGAHVAPDPGDLPAGFGGADARAAEPEPGEDGGDELLDYEADFPTFGQWILNELMNLWIRLNGVGDRQSTATMEDEREDPGPEVNVANASRYYGSQVTMLRMRFQLGLALLVVLAYITLGFPVSGMLKTAKVASAVCLGLQLTVLLLCLDIVTNAAINLTRGRFGADALALLACIITSLDALVVAVGGFGSPHIPLCLFSSLAMVGILFSSLLSARALRKSTRVPAIGKRAYCVTAEEGVRGGRDITLLKSIRPVNGFVRRSEEAPPDETMFNRFAVLELLAVLLLSLVIGLVKHGMRDFLYILSAMMSCTVPVTALTAFALPFFVGSQRIFSSGAAVAGWSGIHDIGCSRNLIVTDRDLFPEETISIETVRVFADESAERVIAYAGSMIAASGSGLGPSFAELMERNNCRMRRVEDFQWLSGGGLQGHIEGHTVLCGSSDLMQLMNVKIPYRLVDRTTVLLSIDGVLYGIFKVVYTGLPEIRSALQELIASNRHPIFAIRDFNVTPEMLHDVFDVATDGYDFPPYGDRFRISEAQPSETSKVSAVICREGLGPLTHLADTGRSMYVAVRLNMLVTALTAVLGTLLVFFRLVGPGLLNAWLPFVLMIVDFILVTLITLFMRF